MPPRAGGPVDLPFPARMSGGGARPDEWTVLDVGDDSAERDGFGTGALAPLTVLAEGWDGDVAEVARAARGVLVETGSWSDDRLIAAIERLLDVPELHDRVIVSCGEHQVDLIAPLLGTGVELLCRPSPTERAGALVRAGGIGRARANDPSGEEASRLAAIAEEVARIAEALSGVARREPPVASAAADRRLAFDLPDVPVTAAQVRSAIRARRLRDALFKAGWFEEPAWDMLLDLFAAELEGTRVSVSSLCIAAAVAQTTALRWITKMVAADLLQRQDDPADRRRAFVTLGTGASRNMRSYFGSVQRMGLGIA